MLDIFFLFFFFLTPISIWFLLRLAGEKVNQVSVLNVTTVSIYAFSVLGLLPLFYRLDEYRADVGVTSQDLVLTVLLCSFIAIIFLLLGAIFLRKALGIQPIPIVSSEVRGLRKENFFALILTLVFVIIVLIVYLSKVEQVAVFAAFKYGVAEAALARSNMGNNFTTYHRYSLVIQEIGTLVTLSFFVLWLLRKKLINFILFFIAFLTSAFVSIMATEKAPFVGLLMALFMSYYLTKTNGFIPKKSLVILGFIVISLLIVFYIYFMGSANPFIAFMDVFSRAFAGSISPAYFYLEYVPNVRDYYLFNTFPNPGHIFPYTPMPYTVEIMNWKFPSHLDSGIVGTMPTVFWGEAYLNFGYIGIPIVAFIMGCFISVVSYLVSRLQLNPVSIAFTVWLIFHLKTLSITGFSGFLYDFYMIGVSISVLLILSCGSKLSLRRLVSSAQKQNL